MKLNRTIIGKINAVIVYSAWACFVLTGLLMVYVYFDEKAGLPIFLASLLILVLLAIIHAILAYFVRCPHCNKCLTVQGFAKPHQNSRVSGKKDAWVVVVKQWFSGSIVCIHCGKEVDTNAL